MMSKLAAKTLIEWAPVSPRIITARFNCKGRKVTLVTCYAPTTNTTDELKQEFYDFPHKTIYKATWISHDGRSSNQIDHIAIGRKWRRSLIDVRVKRGADVGPAKTAHVHHTTNTTPKT